MRRSRVVLRDDLDYARGVDVKGLVWLGTRTTAFDEMRAVLARFTGVEPWIDEPGLAVFDLPNGDRLEVLGPEGDDPPRLEAPLAGLLVEDVDAARRELEAEGVEFVGPVHDGGGGNRWAHFRAPDGHLYELTSRPDHPAHAGGA